MTTTMRRRQLTKMPQHRPTKLRTQMRDDDGIRLTALSLTCSSPLSSPQCPVACLNCCVVRTQFGGTLPRFGQEAGHVDTVKRLKLAAHLTEMHLTIAGADVVHFADQRFFFHRHQKYWHAARVVI